MRRSRWLVEWKDSETKPAIYHCLSRVVDRRFVFGDEEREHFRMFMRIQENFTGCRVLSYCIMSNHFHILLEVPPVPTDGINDDLLLKRLAGLYSAAEVEMVAQQLAEARASDNEAYANDIRERYTYRMHNLSQFMKTLLQRYTRWFNHTHQRRGTLWEERFKSVIVEDGVAAQTMAAYIDLNPVRAGMVKDPAHYRWSSYGEAIGGNAKGIGKKAREGLIRAFLGHEGIGFEITHWAKVSKRYRGLMGMALHRKPGRADVDKKNRSSALPELNQASMLMQRVRYFSDGAVIGSQSFVNEAFRNARERFGPKRKDGARRMRGYAKASQLWSARDLRVGV